VAIKFEWDPRKADANLAKHGVSFDEAMTVFGDSASMTMDDPRHSAAERREITLGRADDSRVLAIAFTERAGVIRLISARPANRRERRRYESK
jgi:uncharacterized DUF497 family protein